ncbi:MAG: sugar kinase [Clostridia bacterium]|nr:sugar kinase [Clostridia bacterium]
MKRVVTFGEIMLRLTPPDHARLIQANTLEVCYGGAEANVAVSLACFGAEASYVTKLPEGEMGQAAINALRRFGVDTAQVARGGSRIGLYYMERGADRRPAKVMYDRARSAVSEAAPTDFDWHGIFQGADWFHLTGITPALSDSLADICTEACRIAKEHGLTVSLDPNYRAKLWSVEKASEVLSRLLPYVDVLITNENQAAELFGVSVPSSEIEGDEVSNEGYRCLAAGLCERYGIPTVALAERRTYSAEDNRFTAKLWANGRLYPARVYRIPHMTDRVGAGDAFAAGLIYALGTGMEPSTAIDFAAAAGCLKHSVEGDFNLVSVEEVNALARGSGSGRVQR